MGVPSPHLKDEGWTQDEQGAVFLEPVMTELRATRTATLPQTASVSHYAHSNGSFGPHLSPQTAILCLRVAKLGWYARWPRPNSVPSRVTRAHNRLSPHSGPSPLLLPAPA